MTESGANTPDPSGARQWGAGSSVGRHGCNRVA
jgi:hypothetical protein